MNWFRIITTQNIRLREGRMLRIRDHQSAILTLRDRFASIDNDSPRRGGPMCHGGVCDAYYLNRLRVNLLIQPASCIKAFAQTQDARVAFKNTKPAAPPYQNTWDLRQAYLELGDSEKGLVGVRTGRQEMNFGEQRLIGS